MDKEEITQLPPALDLPEGIFGRYPKEPPKPQSRNGESKPDTSPTLDLDTLPPNDVSMF